MYPLRKIKWMSSKIKGTFLPFLGFCLLGFEVSVCVWEDGVYIHAERKLAAWLADAWNKQWSCAQLRTGPNSKSREKGSVLSKNQSSWARKEKLKREPYRGFASTWDGLTGRWFQKKICCRRATLEPHFVLNVIFRSVLPFFWAQGFYFSFFLCFLSVAPMGGSRHLWSVVDFLFCYVFLQYGTTSASGLCWFVVLFPFLGKEVLTGLVLGLQHIIANTQNTHSFFFVFFFSVEQ